MSMIVVLLVALVVIGSGLWATVAWFVDHARAPEPPSVLALVVVVVIPVLGPWWYLATRRSRALV